MGYKIGYEEDAIAWTEAPINLRTLAQATIPLGVRHVAVHAEASRRVVSSALWRARLRRHAERLDLSDSVSADFAGDGSDAGLHVARRPDSIACNSRRLFVDRSCGRCFFTTRCFWRLIGSPPCFAFLLEKQGALALAVVAVPAALLLSPGDVLRDDQVSGGRCAGITVGWGKLDRKATAEAQ